MDSGQFINAFTTTIYMFPALRLELSALVVTNRVLALEQMLTRTVALAAMRGMNLHNNNSIVRAAPFGPTVVTASHATGP